MTTCNQTNHFVRTEALPVERCHVLLQALLGFWYAGVVWNNSIDTATSQGNVWTAAAKLLAVRLIARLLILIPEFNRKCGSISCYISEGRIAINRGPEEESRIAETHAGILHKRNQSLSQPTQESVYLWSILLKLSRAI